MPIAGMETADEQELRRYYLFRPCDTREELQQWLIAYLGLDLPDCIVDEDSNSTPLDMVWECYEKMRANNDPDFARVLYYACRDGFKTLGAAAIEVLAVVHLQRSVAHMAAIKEQALKAQSYVKSFFRRPHLRDFVISDNETKTEIRRFYNPVTKHNLTVSEYEALSADQQALHQEMRQALTMYSEREQYIKIIIATMQGANSEHVPLFIIDEVDVVSNPAAYAEAQNIPSSSRGKRALTILTSTRKFAFGLVQDEINRADDTGLHIRHWNLIDITERCPPERHRPDLPRLTLYRSPDTLKTISPETFEGLTMKEKEAYVKADGFNGCGSCRLFATCKTRLATHQKSNSTFLNKIPDVINKFRAQRTVDMAKAQLMCWKPASTGLIYQRFDRTRHVLSPAQAYFKVFGEHPAQGNKLTKVEFLAAIADRDVQWYGGMDFGMGHNFCFVNSFKDGQRLFVTHCFSSPGLETPQAIEQLEPLREQFDPVVYPDMADAQAIRAFRRASWKMRQWKKGAGSIAAGITAVQGKLNPVMADEPELYFVHDVDEDPGMALLVQRIQEYHWKLDAAGKPTAVPQDEDDDEADALRYDVMNVFPMKGGLVAGHNDVTTAGENDAAAATGLTAANQSSGPQNWVQQMIAEATGAVSPSQHPPRVTAPGQKPRLFPDRPRMKIQNPDGSAASYYGEVDPGKPKKRRGSRDSEPDENASRGRSGRLVWNIE